MIALLVGMLIGAGIYHFYFEIKIEEKKMKKMNEMSETLNILKGMMTKK